MNGSYQERGTDGNNSYRGNCSGRLIEDIITQYHIKSLNDYMVGSGTTEDVCKRMNIEGSFFDLNRGYDMIEMDIPERAENIFWHPPYHDIVVYSDKMYKAQDIIARYGFDPRTNDLSRCKNWKDFVSKMNYCCLKQYSALENGGRMFILMGDIKRKGILYSMLTDIVKPGTMEQIIIKAQHNCWSDNQTYSNRNFVPITHEYLLILKKKDALIIPIKVTVDQSLDIRDTSATWRDVVVAILKDKGAMTLEEIYKCVDGHKKCLSNIHWKEKIRQTLQQYQRFTNVSRGVWQYV
jgi:hypothetical protein